MIKILGFLAGLALAVAGMVYYLDPHPPPPPVPAAMPIPPDTGETAEQPTPPHENLNEIEDVTETETEKINEFALTDVPPTPAPTPVAATPPSLPVDQPFEDAPPQTMATPSAEATPGSDVEDAPSAEPLHLPPAEADRYWHVFWKPFTTRLSAQGFGNHIAHVTGVPVTVIEKAAGQYVVAFSYQDTVDLENKIARIEQHARIKIPARRSAHD